ncbi:MAG TPA: tRNA (adenosine(37)-N6)-threonylcarbamoyltransferase complex ATPase subunit type 1 TsaE [Candidatus Saccharibacteria bacterium]|nr:tRNA (adenosine(37)-N6)-threonylcarbamoyltransferase complex ATPase subunit type 1 TsaE [Candidatus Saccharibacteria bacterium]HRK93903.1 tRNA (adenosine(37)-N6)-threonylcarbamoyltransferase complex ATPase subunit type 1 TsaE [Candidatus Saccharibacteria bacterium]
MKKELSSEDAMKSWGAEIGALLQGGEFIELIGDIGAGKTTFTKGLALGLGITDTVQSPTFTISRLYDGRDNLRLAHYDFYRLNDAGIMAEELRETSQEPSTIIAVEWGDIVADVRPEDYLQLRFTSPTEHSREVTVAAHGERSTRLLEKLS